MDEWIRVGDHEPFPFRRRVFTFEHDDKKYSVSIGPPDEDNLEIEFSGETELWPIFRIHKKADQYKISGMAYDVPGIIDKTYWFDLLLNDEPQITFWGTKSFTESIILVFDDDNLSRAGGLKR